MRATPKSKHIYFLPVVLFVHPDRRGCSCGAFSPIQWDKIAVSRSMTSKNHDRATRVIVCYLMSSSFFVIKITVQRKMCLYAGTRCLCLWQEGNSHRMITLASTNSKQFIWFLGSFPFFTKKPLDRCWILLNPSPCALSELKHQGVRILFWWCCFQ